MVCIMIWKREYSSQFDHKTTKNTSISHLHIMENNEHHAHLFIYRWYLLLVQKCTFFYVQNKISDGIHPLNDMHTKDHQSSTTIAFYYFASKCYSFIVTKNYCACDWDEPFTGLTYGLGAFIAFTTNCQALTVEQNNEN